MNFRDLETTAHVLRMINPSVAKCPDLEAQMQGFAYLLAHEGHASGSTFGYQITIFTDSAGEKNCYFSLTTYGVAKYLGLV